MSAATNGSNGKEIVQSANGARPGPNPRFMTKLARIESFVDLHLLEPPEDGKGKPIPCRCFELVRVTVDGRQGGHSRRFEIRQGGNVETIAQQILDQAQDEANELQDTLTFELKVYHGSTGGMETASLPLKIVGEKRRGDGGFDPIGLGEMTEPATSQGERAQAMRHREAEQSLSLRGFSTNMDVLMKINDRLGERVEQLEKRVSELLNEQTNMIREHQATLDEQSRREAERIQLINSERRKDMFLQNAQLLIPVIVNRLAGQKILPEGSVSAFKEMARQFVGSIQVENGQYEQLMNSLNPAQRVALMEIMATLTDEEEAEKAKAEAERRRIEGIANDPRELAKVPQIPSGAAPTQQLQK